MRGLLLQVHRYTGLAACVFLLIAAATGVPLVFRGALDAALTPELHRVEPRGAAASPAAVAEALQRLLPQAQVTAVPLAEAPGRTLQATVAARSDRRPLGYDQVFMDPYRLRIVGVRQDIPGLDRAHLMRGVYFLHYTLLAGDFGRWLMGLVALAWLVGNLVGFYLTLPSGGPFWRRWTPIWKVNLKARWPRVLLDLHRASGLWLFIGVVLLSATSVAMNFYSEAYRPLISALSPPKPSPWDRPPPPGAGRAPRQDFGHAQTLAIAAARRDGLTLRPAVETYDPAYGLYGVRFTRDGRENYAGYGMVSYYVDGQDGRLVYVDDPATDSLGEKLLRILYPLHSGQIAWLPTRLLVCVLGLAVLEMSITGVVVWWRKRPARVAARKARRAAGTKLRTAQP